MTTLELISMWVLPLTCLVIWVMMVMSSKLRVLLPVSSKRTKLWFSNAICLYEKKLPGLFIKENFFSCCFALIFPLLFFLSHHHPLCVHLNILTLKFSRHEDSWITWLHPVMYFEEVPWGEEKQRRQTKHQTVHETPLTSLLWADCFYYTFLFPLFLFLVYTSSSAI